MANVLVLFAHPVFEKSRLHKTLVKAVRDLEGVTFHDLYEAYPDFDINVDREQALLMKHDVVVMQHPFYWYSSPAILKQWQDLVLEHGWAYGRGGTQLAGKAMFNAITAGGREDVYISTGYNRYTIRELLAPFDQMANLCRMKYLPPFVIHDTHRLNDHEIELFGIQYRQLLLSFVNNTISQSELNSVKYLNGLAPIPVALKA